MIDCQLIDNANLDFVVDIVSAPEDQVFGCRVRQGSSKGQASLIKSRMEISRNRCWSRCRERKMAGDADQSQESQCKRPSADDIPASHANHRVEYMTRNGTINLIA